MTCFVCTTCATQYAAAEAPPAICPVCADDRQHVGWDGQTWTTHDELASTLHNRIEHDGDLLGIGVVERFAIPSARCWSTTDVGNVLWDCVGVVTPAAIDEIGDAAGST